jgi:hypothetical protein
MPTAPSPQWSAGVPANGSEDAPVSGLCGAIFLGGDPKPEIAGAPFNARSRPDASDVPAGACDDAPLEVGEAAAHPLATRLTAIATVIAPALSQGRRSLLSLSP